MSSNIFNKTVKELVPDIAQAIFDEIKVPRVGGQRIRVAGFTRDILEGVYLALSKLLTNKSKELYKICFIAGRAGKSVPITPVERVMEYRTIPTIKALVVFDPWKIEEYGKNLFLKYSFRDFPIADFLREYSEKKIASAAPNIRSAYFAVRNCFTGNFPKRERPLREALFAHFFAAGDFTWESFGKSLKFFNVFPDGSLDDKNAIERLKANSDLSRLFIYSRLPMKERILLLCPRDREAASNLLKFFVTRDGVLPEFWLHGLSENNPELMFDRWCSSYFSDAIIPLSTSFDGIGRDRRANREVIITWEMPYGRVQFGSVCFRIWHDDIVIAEHVLRNANDSRYILDLETIDPGLYQLQVFLSSSSSARIAESWSPPFWWSGIELGAPRRPKDAEKITWAHGKKAPDVPTAMYFHLCNNPVQKRKKRELIANSARVSPVPFPSGDTLLEVTLPDQVREFIQVPESFKVLEKAVIEEIKGIYRFSLNFKEKYPTLKKEEVTLSGEYDEFMLARKQLLMQIKAAGGSSSSLNFTSIRPSVIKYLVEYNELLAKLLKSQAKVIRDELLFIDTVALKNGSRTLGILTLPTHPIELAFRLGYQHLLTNAWQAIYRSSSNTTSPFKPEFTSLRSKFTKILATSEGTHYVLTRVVHPGFSLFLAEEVDFYQLLRKWSRYARGTNQELLETSRAKVKDTLEFFSDCSAISVAVIGIMDSSTVQEFCLLLAESLPDNNIEFDVTFFGAPTGVIDRTKREIERRIKNFCLHDLSADPEVWRKRFPFDRFRLLSGTTESIESYHVAYIIPNFRVKVESFESRVKCAASFHEGITTVNVPFSEDIGAVQWSGAGPRKEQEHSEDTFDVVRRVNDLFSASASKISLQKIAANNHLKVTPTVSTADSNFAKALISNSVVSLCVSLTSSDCILKNLAPDEFAVGSSCNTVAVALNTNTSPAGNALREHLSKVTKKSTKRLFENLQKSITVPTTLLRMNDGEKILSQLLTRRALSVLSLTKDGIPVVPAHYPKLFKGGPWPGLILFKFRDKSVVPLLVEPVFVNNVTKPDLIELPKGFQSRLDDCVISVDNFFQLFEEYPDGVFGWAKLGEILLSELRVLCQNKEMSEKDAATLADNINSVISEKKSPSRDVITPFPLILLPKAKGQLIGRAFPKIHPLCRVLSGEEIDQWIKK